MIRALVRGERLNPFGLRWEHFWLAETPPDATGSGEPRVVGCAQARPHRDGSRELASLVTVPAWRGRGVGERLVRHVMAETGPPLYLMCAARLAGYYRRFGFAIVPADAPLPPHFHRIRLLARLFNPFRAPRLAIMAWRGQLGRDSPGPES